MPIDLWEDHNSSNDTNYACRNLGQLEQGGPGVEDAVCRALQKAIQDMCVTMARITKIPARARPIIVE